MPHKDPEERRRYHAQWYQSNKPRLAEARKVDDAKAHRRERRRTKGYKGQKFPSIARYQKVRAEFVDSIKVYYGCTNPACGWDGAFEPCQLDLHHIDEATKEFNLSRPHCSMRRVYTEINKCCVLCSNCHRRVTVEGTDCSTFQKCNLDPDGRVHGPV